MRFRIATWLIAPLLLATPALGQQTDPADPVFNLPPTTQPQADPRRQGPELDVFRGAPTTVIPPPVVVVPPPVLEPQVPTRTDAQPVSPPSTPRTAVPVPAEPQRTEPPASPEPAQTVPAETVAPSQSSVPQATPVPVLQPKADITERPVAPTEDSVPWLWIIGGLVFLVALVAGTALLRRRRGKSEAEPESWPEEEESIAPPRAEPARPAPARTSVPTGVKPVSTERPQIELAMEVRNARLSLMGATIGYTLTLQNKGERAAEDILIRSLITNADAGQQDALKQFFAGQLGLPTHSVVSIAPGEMTHLTGELRLMPDQISPVQMGNRSLLIPLIAFDAQYRWIGEEGDLTGTGRVGRAFIAGQEKSPPADRLAPFRLDLGPRQYRDPGSRATMLTLAS